jgi:hypothetical protein
MDNKVLEEPAVSIYWIKGSGSTLITHELCTVLQHFLLRYIGTSFKVLSMYIIQVFIGCLLWADHISLYKQDLCLIYVL